MKRQPRRVNNRIKFKKSIIISDCTTITELQNRCTEAALIIDSLLLDMIETAYNNPMYKEQLKEIHNAVADTPVLLKGLVAYFNREEGLFTPTLEKVEEDENRTITETNG